MLQSMTNSFDNIIYVVCDKDKKTPLAGTNGSSRNLVIQAFLHRINPRFPPFCVEGNLVGPNAKETWESIASQKNLEVFRFFVALPEENIPEMETVND